MGNFRGDSRGGRDGGRSFGRRDFGNDRGGFSRGGGRDREDRPMFKAVCSNCGKDCEVPFRPTNGKPVYCSDCFEKLGTRRSDSFDSGRPERSDFRAPAPNPVQNNNQLDALSSKLDRIIKLLEAKGTPEVSKSVVEAPQNVTVLKEVKAPKVKKEAKKASKKKK